MIPNQPSIEPIEPIRPFVDPSDVLSSWDLEGFASTEISSFQDDEPLFDVSTPDLNRLSQDVQKATDAALAPNVDSELPYEYLAKKSDMKSRLVLEGTCTYHKPRPPLVKDTTPLTEDEINAYRAARDQKVILNNLLFGLFEQHIEDVVQLGLLRDEIDPIITLKQPRAGCFNFESFLLFCAKQNPLNTVPKAKATEWLEAWKAMKAIRIANDPAITEKISELRSFQPTPDEVADNGRAKLWFRINKIYRREQTLAQLQISKEDALQLINAGNLLYRITDLIESIEQKIWGDHIVSDYQKNPATGRYPLFKMACQFSKVIHPLMDILNEYQDFYKDCLKNFNPGLDLAQNFKVTAQTQTVIVKTLGSLNKNKLQEFIARLLDLKKRLENTLENLPNPDKVVDKIAAKEILQNNQVLHQIEELSGINPATLIALLKNANIGIVNNFLQSKPEDLRLTYRAKGTGYGPRIKEALDLHHNHFSRLLSNHYGLITGNDADKGGMASLDLLVTELQNKSQIDCKTQLAVTLQEMFKDFGRDYLSSSTQAVKTSDLIKSFSKDVLETVKNELTQNFKQYKQHSFLRFLNLITIHHRHKQNIDAIIELVPKDFPARDTLIEEFRQFMREVINSSLEDDDTKHLFDYRKLQASCKGKEEAPTCRQEMDILYNVLYLYHMHHIDGADTTAKGAYFDELEESHVIPFPAIWGYHYEKLKLGNGNDAIAFPREAIANYLSSHGWCFSKAVAKDGTLNIEKFQAGFARLLADVREEIIKLDPADPDYQKAIKFSMIQAFVMVNMAAIHESSQTSHLISMSNKVMDRLSETALNAGKYKQGLAESFLGLLDANPDDTLGTHYNWYYEETLKTVDCFSKSVMGYAHTPLNIQVGTIQNVFQSGNTVTVLGKRFRIESEIYGAFRGILNELSKDPKQFYVDSLYALSIMVKEIPLNTQEAKVFLNEIMESYAYLKKEPTSVCFTDKRKEKAKLLKLLYDLVPFESIESHVKCATSRPNRVIEEPIRRIRALFRQKQDVEFRALRINKKYVDSEQSLAKFGKMVTGLMLLRLAACIPQAICYAQPLSVNKKVYQVQP